MGSKQDHSQVIEQLNARMFSMKDDIFAAIKDVIAIDSSKGQPAEGAPYGEGPKRALDYVLALGKKLGFRTGNLDNRIGWIEHGSGKEMAAVLGHLDVVPPGDGWDYPALDGEIHDGYMYGRGIVDDKGPVIGAIFGLGAIRDLCLPTSRRIRVIFGCDEENGCSCVRHYKAAGGELPTIGFTPDAQFPAIFCEKGMCFWTLSRKVGQQSAIPGTVATPAARILSIEGGSAPNVVMGRCTMVVEGDIDVAAAPGITVSHSAGQTTILAEGKSAHGSRPEQGVNAGITLLEAVRASDEINCDLGDAFRFILEKIGRETNGSSLGIRWQDDETGETTVNLGMISFHDGELSFTLDIRYPKSADREKLIGNVQAAAKEYGLDARMDFEEKLLYVPKDSELVTKLAGVYKDVTGRDEQPIAIGGGTYAKEFENMVAFGPCFPEDPDVIHQPNERTDVDRMMLSFQIVANAMHAIAQ